MVWDEGSAAVAHQALVWLDAPCYPEFRDSPILTWAANAAGREAAVILSDPAGLAGAYAALCRAILTFASLRRFNRLLVETVWAFSASRPTLEQGRQAKA